MFFCSPVNHHVTAWLLFCLSNSCMWFLFFSMPSHISVMIFSVEPPEGQEVSSTDHWLVPVFPQLWDRHFFSHHQQEPSVQAGEGDENLHCTAMPWPDCSSQGRLNLTWIKETETDGEHRSNIHVPAKIASYHNNLRLTQWSRNALW